MPEQPALDESDIEEPEEVLNEDQGDPVEFWESKQRDLVVSVLNYNLLTLSELITSDKIDLSPRYQRRSRWDARRQSTLIESFLMNVPVPSVFLNEDDYGRYSVIDGKQRLTAVNEFLRGRLKLTGLKVFKELNGTNFDTMPSQLKNALATRAALQAIIILRQSDKDVKFEVFKRLNTGGVKLNPQEIRNSTWPGPFNNLVLELSEIPEFHQLLGIIRKERSTIWREMRDAEFVLRFFTFRHTWKTFTGGMQRHMDSFMADHQYAGDSEIQEMESAFMRSVAAVKAGFADHAFHRWVPKAHQWRKQVIAALYDAQMFACADKDPSVLAEKRGALLTGMQDLFSDDTFRQSIDAATNTPALFKTRIALVRQLVDDVTSGS